MSNLNFEYSNISLQDIYQFLVIICIIFAFALFLYLNPNVGEILCLFTSGISHYIYHRRLSVYSNNRITNSTIYMFFGALLVFVLLYYAYDYFKTLDLANSQTYIFISQLFLVLSFSGYVIIFNVFSEKIRRIPGMLGFIINFIFYIPCIFSDIIGYFKTQLKLTPSITYLLLYIETLIIVYFLLPIIYKDLIARRIYYHAET